MFNVSSSAVVITLAKYWVSESEGINSTVAVVASTFFALIWIAKPSSLEGVKVITNSVHSDSAPLPVAFTANV